MILPLSTWVSLAVDGFSLLPLVPSLSRRGLWPAFYRQQARVLGYKEITGLPL